MKKVNFYIDGLNIYFKIKEYCYRTHNKFNYKWLDYYRLCKSFLLTTEELGTIYLFTTRFDSHTSNSPRAKRYMAFKNAWENSGIKIIEGYINKISHQEKETDVNIAVQLLSDAIFDEFDTAFLFSGDNDFAAVFKAIKNLILSGKIKEKRLGLITPPFDPQILPISGHSRLLKSCSLTENGNPLKIKLKFDMLRGFSLPKKIYDSNGKLISEMPLDYMTF